MLLREPGADKQLFCRCAVAEELCHQVRQIQEEVNRLCRIPGNRQLLNSVFTEMLQS